jgi:fructoselysine 3-epimerase
MKIALNSWMYCSFPAWLPLRSLDEVIDGVARMGFDGVEIGAAAPHGFPDYLDQGRRQSIRERTEARGIEIAALCPALGGGPGYNPAARDEHERRASERYVADCIQLAADIGCRTVIWLGGYRALGQPYAEAWSYAVENLAAAARTAREAGVHLTVEPTSADSNLIEHAGDCLRILDDAGVGPDVAGVMLDTFHIFHRHDEVREAFALAGDRLSYAHLADLNRDPPGAHRDFTPVVEALSDLGYDGWLSLEIGFNRRESNPDALVRAGLDHVRGALTSVSATAP